MNEAIRKHLQGLGPWTPEEIRGVLASGAWANGNLLDPAEREGLEEMQEDLDPETDHDVGDETEPDEPSDAVQCVSCGRTISDAECDDNGGFCADCAESL